MCLCLEATAISTQHRSQEGFFPFPFRVQYLFLHQTQNQRELSTRCPSSSSAGGILHRRRRHRMLLRLRTALREEIERSLLARRRDTRRTTTEREMAIAWVRHMRVRGEDKKGTTTTSSTKSSEDTKVCKPKMPLNIAALIYFSSFTRWVLRATRLYSLTSTWTDT